MPSRPEHLQLARQHAARFGNVAAKVRAIDELELPVTQREIAEIVGLSRARVSQILEGRAFVLRQRAQKRAWRRAKGMPEYSCTECGEPGHNASTCEGAASAATDPTSDRTDRTSATASGT